METDASSPWGKAKRKSPAIHAAVELEFAPKAALEREPITCVQHVFILEELRSVLPQGYRCFVPDCPSTARLGRVTDFEQLLNILCLPQFAKRYPPDWQKYFARHVEDKQQLMVCLSALFEAGYGPEARADDIHQASWLLLYADERHRATKWSRDDNEDSQVVTSTEMHVWTMERLATVRASLERKRSGFRAGIWNPQSVLKNLGYRVGAGADAATVRRLHLRDATMLPTCLLPETQRSLWGGAGTTRRVRAIGRMLELFLALARNREHHDTTVACGHWESDLTWLEFTHRTAAPRSGGLS